MSCSPRSIAILDSAGRPATRRPFGHLIPWPLVGMVALLWCREVASGTAVGRATSCQCIAQLESASQRTMPAGQGAAEQATACASESRPWAVTRWAWSWQGWDGLHYTGFRRNRSGWAWSRDEEKPAIPALFLDRVDVAGKIGGRVDLDAAFFVNGGGMDSVANQIEVRRWRFYTSGDAIFLVPFSYSLNVMAVDGAHFVLDDVFQEFKRLPYVGNLRVGSFIP